MKAAILEKLNTPLHVTESQKPVAESGFAIVQVLAASLNHRDVWIQKGQYAGIQLPVILGSDGVGILKDTDSPELESLLGKHVVINPGLNWGTNPRVQSKEYVILGTPHNGTLSEYVKVPSDRIHAAPTHLSTTEASAIPLAGLTAYRALVGRAKAAKGEKVLITGVGGGVALYCAQFALALGCEVYATTGHPDKIGKAKNMGIAAVVNYKDSDWDKQLKKLCPQGFDVLIDSSGGSTFAKLVDLAKPAARIAMYGATLGNFDSGVAAKIFWKQLDILGSTMGNDVEFAEMLAFVQQHAIRPVIDSVFNLSEINQAMLRMEMSEQFGKICITIGS